MRGTPPSVGVFGMIGIILVVLMILYLKDYGAVTKLPSSINRGGRG